MTRSTLRYPPASTVTQYLLTYYSEPPDAASVAAIAAYYKTTPEDVWAAVRQCVPETAPRKSFARVEPSPAVDARHPYDRVLSALRAKGSRIRLYRDQRGREAARAQCPAHPDKNPSLVVTRDGGHVLLYCWGGCTPKNKRGAARVQKIADALGLTAADLCPPFDDDLPARSQPKEVMAEYPYFSRNGALVATKVRYRTRSNPKCFAWRVGDRWSLEDAEKAALPLYCERDLIEESTVYIVEGEKAADALWALGVPATCGPCAARTWRPCWTESLRVLGVQHVVILVDNDAPGRAHGELVAAELYASQIAAQVVALPDLGAGQDVYDWLAQGGTVADLESIVATTPAWSPGLTERQRIDRQRKQWREKKQNQRLKRRERESAGVSPRSSAPVPLRMSDAERVPPRMSGPDAMSPLSPCPPRVRTSDPHSKGVDSSYLSTDLEALPTSEGELDIEVSLCREIEFDLEIHPGGADDGDDDG